MGYTNITVVKEQEQSDGNFPTCSYPNPEVKEAMALGMEQASKNCCRVTRPVCCWITYAASE